MLTSLFVERFHFPATLRGPLRDLAAREGVVHANSEGELYGLAPFTPLDIGALEDHGAHRAALKVLRGCTTLGVEGPALSSPRIHAALPFNPAERALGLLPAIQVTIIGDEGWLTILGTSPEEVHSFYDTVLERLDSPVTTPPSTGGDLTVLERPGPQGYQTMVASAMDLINAGALEKVVLSRSVDLRADHDFDLARILSTMSEREPSCTLYAIPVDDARLIGASPELLLKLDQGIVTSHPLAGTISLTAHGAAEELAASGKDLEEHRLVVVDIAARLADAVEDLDVPTKPTLVALRSVAHLGTTISAKLSPTSEFDSLDLLARIHPTPAIEGVPHAQSRAVIQELEDGPRGLFGGAVGWINASGDGEWVLGIRGALVSENEAVVRAGAGIVTGSTPEGEAEETRVKLSSILEAIEPGASTQLDLIG